MIVKKVINFTHFRRFIFTANFIQVGKYLLNFNNIEYFQNIGIVNEVGTTIYITILYVRNMYNNEQYNIIRNNNI